MGDCVRCTSLRVVLGGGRAFEVGFGATGCPGVALLLIVSGRCPFGTMKNKYLDLLTLVMGAPVGLLSGLWRGPWR